MNRYFSSDGRVFMWLQFVFCALLFDITPSHLLGLATVKDGLVLWETLVGEWWMEKEEGEACKAGSSMCTLCADSKVLSLKATSFRRINQYTVSINVIFISPRPGRIRRLTVWKCFKRSTVMRESHFPDGPTMGEMMARWGDGQAPTPTLYFNEPIKHTAYLPLPVSSSIIPSHPVFRFWIGLRRKTTQKKKMAEARNIGKFLRT